eukprot:CAMPEP_0172665958 /NCGR_PEP_ID=MMETSP1074-20121228/7542_1 /TAXON_ID=2916 /ORGANISM="Ceratium fusus, Strain PA161109" /LENGTH=347 /DNA_ID=CAMNT_0013482313 /DNA_START=159 /DNA_END=1202 /DNA_ORIENTATION=+
MAVWLLACHAYFAFSRPVQTELLEPCLPIPTAGAQAGAGFLEGLPQEARLMALKQLSPARQRIGLAKDIPQIFGADTREGLDQATLSIVSLVVSRLRILLAVPPVQCRIYDSMIEPIRQARSAALTAENAPKVLHSTLVLWSLNPEESGLELKQVGWVAAEVKEEGVSSEHLKAATYSAQDLKSAGYSAQDLKSAGYSAMDLKPAGYSAQEMRSAGHSAQDLKSVGYSLQEMRYAGYSAEELTCARYSARDLKSAGYSAQDLNSAGYSAQHLKSIRYSLQELKSTGYSAYDLKSAGYSAKDLKSAEYSCQDLNYAGYSLRAEDCRVQSPAVGVRRVPWQGSAGCRVL